MLQLHSSQGWLFKGKDDLDGLRGEEKIIYVHTEAPKLVLNQIAGQFREGEYSVIVENSEILHMCTYPASHQGTQPVSVSTNFNPIESSIALHKLSSCGPLAMKMVQNPAVGKPFNRPTPKGETVAKAIEKLSHWCHSSLACHAPDTQHTGGCSPLDHCGCLWIATLSIWSIWGLWQASLLTRVSLQMLAASPVAVAATTAAIATKVSSEIWSKFVSLVLRRGSSFVGAVHTSLFLYCPKI